MSEVLIKMKMPTSCYECAIKSWNGEDDVCPFSEISALSIGIQNDCPLIPVPPHGRLIDADALKAIVADAKHMDADIFDGKTMYSDHLCVGADYDDVCMAIDETPTIIPAEEGVT